MWGVHGAKKYSKENVTNTLCSEDTQSMGTVVISLDAELAWGFVDFPVLPGRRLARAREMWLELVELFEKYDLPATWAVVGHLFLEDCDGRHPNHPLDATWFDIERSSGQEDLWCAPTLIDTVADASVDHEIACHSFSHVNFQASRVSKSVVTAELGRCHKLADRCGIELSSFVFPRNRVAHRDVLAESGFRCYRGRQPPCWHTDNRLTPLVRAVSGSPLGITPPIVQPRVDDHGLVEIPASLLLFCFEGWARQITETLWADPVVKMVQRGVDQVDGGDGILHLWLHPNNLINDAGIERMESVLSYIDQKRGPGLAVRTMDTVAQRTVGSAPQQTW